MERVWGLFEMVEDAVEFLEIFGSIQLKSVMQRLAVLVLIDLLQCTALIYYCSAPQKVIPVEDVMQ